MNTGPVRTAIARKAGRVARLAGLVACAMAPHAMAAVPPSGLCGRGPLEILLSNDDGYQSAGIRALRTQLLAAGHRVTLAAPDYNASGSAMSFTWGNVRVTPDPTEPEVFGVAATPATSVVLAATALYRDGRRPDLVISGINHGSNTGSLLVLSGTVGAALAATLMLDPPVPGIAVNAVRMHASEAADSPANRAQFEAVSGHFTKLLESLRAWYCDGGQVARARSVLNVNYPARAVGALRGVAAARQGSTTDLHVTFTAGSDGQFKSQTSERAPDDADDSDNERLEQGYVTVTPLDARIGADDRTYRELERRLRRF